MEASSSGVRRVFAIVVICAVVAVLTSACVGAQPAGEHEPNDNRTAATSVANGASHTGNITLDESGEADRDWYAFEANAGQAIRITFGEANTNYTLYGPGGSRLDTGVGGPSEGESYTMGTVAEEDGTYYLRATNSSYSMAPTGSGISYWFALDIADPDPFEPNENPDSAFSLDHDANQSGAVFENDTDWFAVDLEKGQNLTATLELADPFEGIPGVNVDIFGSDGTHLGNHEMGRNVTDYTTTERRTGKQRVTANRSGTYYVRVSPRTPATDESIADEYRLNGFAKYDLRLNTTDERTADTATDDESNSPQSLVIVGGSAENKVTYAFTTDGTVERSGESHGVPIDDGAVTVDPDVDTITNGRVDGRLGGGGDAYLVRGNVTGLRLDGDATVYLDGREADPSSFDDVAGRGTATQTATPTTTPTATTETPNPTATATRTATVSTAVPSSAPATATATTTETATATGDTVTTANESNGEIVGGTETTTGNGPGFGVAIAVLAVLGVVSVALRR